MTYLVTDESNPTDLFSTNITCMISTRTSEVTVLLSIRIQSRITAAVVQMVLIDIRYRYGQLIIPRKEEKNHSLHVSYDDI